MKRVPVEFDDPQEVEAGPALAVHSLGGTGRRLVVSLAGDGGRPGAIPPIEFIGSASCGGENHVLFISDPRRSWLNGPGVAEGIVKTIERYRARHDIEDLVLLGNSMAGFAALRLTEMMPVDTVIAFAPQFSVHPDLVPEETRWRPYVNRIQNWVYPDVGDLKQEDTNYYLFHGDDPEEARHWLRFPWHRGLSHFIFCGMGHRVAKIFQKRRLLAQVLQSAMDGRPRVVRRALQRSPFGRRFESHRREEYHRRFPELRLEALAQQGREEDDK
ncbi:MAG: alpha/beta hydrolase [Rhodobacteraceae bacterium]|nr:alpha/beta hydrolase [Paracoccaceae bacterium]